MEVEAAKSLIDFENPVFRAYVFWSAVLVIKMLAMSFLTGKSRMSNQVSVFCFIEKFILVKKSFA